MVGSDLEDFSADSTSSSILTVISGKELCKDSDVSVNSFVLVEMLGMDARRRAFCRLLSMVAFVVVLCVLARPRYPRTASSSFFPCRRACFRLARLLSELTLARSFGF